MPQTCYSIFASQNKIIPGYLNNIKSGQKAKYLGIIIDDKLNWYAHIEQLIKGLVKISNSFKTIKNLYTHQRQKQTLLWIYTFYNSVWHRNVWTSM